MYPSFVKFKNIEIPEDARILWKDIFRYKSSPDDPFWIKSKNKFATEGTTVKEIPQDLSGSEHMERIYKLLPRVLLKHMFPEVDLSIFEELMPQAGYMYAGSSVTEHTDNWMMPKDPLILAFTDMSVTVNKKRYEVAKGDIVSIPTNIPHSMDPAPHDQIWVAVRCGIDVARCSIEHLADMFEYEYIDYLDLKEIKGGLKRRGIS